MNDFIVVTTMGKVGDAMLTLPVASKLYRDTGKKILYAIPPMWSKCKDLIKIQPFVEDVVIVDFPVEGYGYGGQPYKFNPNDFGIPCEVYYNLGFRDYPYSTYVPKFYAEEYGLDYDRDFVLYLGEVEATDEILCAEPALLELGCVTDESAQILDIWNDNILLGARAMKAAKERHCFFSGMAVILDLANVPFYLWWQPKERTWETYFRGVNFVQAIDITPFILNQKKEVVHRIKREYSAVSNYVKGTETVYSPRDIAISLNSKADEKLCMHQDIGELGEFICMLQSRKFKLGLDIGVASGGTTKFIRDFVSIEKTIIVDIGTGYYNLFENEWRRIKQFIRSEIIDEIICDSTSDECKQRLSRYAGMIDFCFVDGGHLYEIAKSDTELVYPLMVNGGIIAFHDSYSEDGIKKLMIELSADPRFNKIAEISNQALGITVFEIVK